jgi:hypothetical protein
MRTPWGTPRAVRAEVESQKAEVESQAARTQQEVTDETPATKCCPKCKIEKPTSEFRTLRSGELTWWCKECDNAYKRERRKKNPEQPGARRGLHFQRTYGITPAEYGALLTAQWGLCAICGKGERRMGGRHGTTPKALSVDHDPRTGKIRGLLCDMCNRGMGYFGHDPQLLMKAARYLETNKD